MYYVWEITIPANTSASTPQKTVLILERGTITHVEVQFPPGPSGLAHARILDNIHQVWPKNPLNYFTGDDQTIAFDDSYPINIPPYQLEAETWNEDDTYDHTIIIRILITPSVPIAESAWEGEPILIT